MPNIQKHTRQVETLGGESFIVEITVDMDALALEMARKMQNKRADQSAACMGSVVVKRVRGGEYSVALRDTHHFYTHNGAFVGDRAQAGTWTKSVAETHVRALEAKGVQAYAFKRVETADPVRAALQAVHDMATPWAQERGYKTLRAWAEAHANHERAQVRHNAAVTLQMCEALGK